MDKASTDSSSQNLGNTIKFRRTNEKQSAHQVLMSVYAAMTEKGYDPVDQIVGYLLSGDPTYITSHRGARSLIMKVERDELVEEILKAYITNNSWD